MRAIDASRIRSHIPARSRSRPSSTVRHSWSERMPGRGIRLQPLADEARAHGRRRARRPSRASFSSSEGSPATTPGKFIISASPSTRLRRISDSRSPGARARRGDSNGDAGTHDGAMKKTSSWRSADASSSQWTPSDAEHVRDLVRVGDDGRRPERQHEARELVDEQLHRLEVHVRVDEARARRTGPSRRSPRRRRTRRSRRSRRRRSRRRASSHSRVKTQSTRPPRTTVSAGSSPRATASLRSSRDIGLTITSPPSMGTFDVLVRGARVVGPDSVTRADLGILDGLIAEIGAELEGGAATEIDATGLHVFPGVVDPHVHFNDPGRADWEGFATGTAAFAAGGGTCLFDMPLNASPPTVDGASFDLKVEAARGAALVDFCLWGGLVPGDVDRLDELAERGVVGFKAFMCNTGIDDFRAADDLTLLRGDGARRAARAARRRARRERRDHAASSRRGRARRGGVAMRDYLALAARVGRARGGRAARSRSPRRRAARSTSSTSSTAAAVAARRRGARARRRRDLRDVPALPPAHRRGRRADRRAREVLAAAAAARRGRGALGGAARRARSRSSPPTTRRRRRTLKQGDDAFAIWGGISGCQTLRGARCSPSRRAAGLTLEAVASLTARAAAERFGLAGKGRLEPGFDADLALVDLGHESVARGRRPALPPPRTARSSAAPLRGRVVRTLLRGQTVIEDGAVVAAGRVTAGSSRPR